MCEPDHGNRLCRVCKQPIPPARLGMYCSDECKRTYSRKYHRAYYNNQRSAGLSKRQKDRVIPNPPDAKKLGPAYTQSSLASAPPSKFLSRIESILRGDAILVSTKGRTTDEDVSVKAQQYDREAHPPIRQGRKRS